MSRKGRDRRRRERQRSKQIISVPGPIQFEALLPGEWRNTVVEGKEEHVLYHRDLGGTEHAVCRVRQT